MLLGSEILALEAEYPHMFYHYPVLSQPPANGWLGGRGWVTAGHIRDALLAGAARCGCTELLLGEQHGFRRTAFVCGTDGFVDTVCGDKVRLPPTLASGGKEQKLQGPVRGLLRELGYETTEVTRM
jgi:hypothetical protein